ncbi:hypothetical protein [Floridanema evergladense]|uniref:Uncharacterized protein n=1 Tax=Floridaenema evergladense BLCC-F167 TaxID=3153639 RepID=A0ABV4WD28_9CYAN
MDKDDVIESLRMELDQRRGYSKLQDIKCKCGKGSTGKLGKRDFKNGLVEVKLKRGKKGVVKCHDIGIGQLAKGSEVMAYIPGKDQIGFVDYKS